VRWPAGQVAGKRTIRADGQPDHAIAGASAVNDTAVAAYQLSVQAGNPTLRTQARPDVRPHIPPLGASENRRCTTSTAMPRLAGQPCHGLTADSVSILAGELGAMTS